MPEFTAAERFSHDQPTLSAVLLVQLGTPDAPEPAPVRRYLSQFLSDPRVVEIPRPLWMLILHGIILRFRPGASARKYAAVWTQAGSPLAVHTQAQSAALGATLSEHVPGVQVAYAMRYGNPSIQEVLLQLRERGLQRLLVLPLYPQYSASTTATVWDTVFHTLQSWRNLPELRLIRSFHRHPAYIAAMAARIREHWAEHGRAERLVFSFHGVPKRSLLLGDPYHCECHSSARLLATALGLVPGEYLVTFQSRFGRAEWLQPYTEPTLIDLASKGLRNVEVFCPGFVSDCLETLEEIAMEARQSFLGAGGQDFRYISCVNDRPGFIDALADLVRQHGHGWLVDPVEAEAADTAEPSSAAEARTRRLERARALGADR
jgi:ferrochelatase